MKRKKLYIDREEKGTVSLADTFFLRLRGMLGRSFDGFDALCIKPCGEIHTMFMAYPIDVLFVDKDGVVVHIIENLRPWVFYAGNRKSRFVIELPTGKAREWNVKVGNRISMN